MARAARGPRVWTLTFMAAVVVNFLLNLVFYMLMTTIAAYAMGRFGADGTTAGLAASIFVLGALVFRLLSTALVDRVGTMRLFGVGVGLALVFSVLYLLAAPLWALLVVRFMHGAGFGLAHSAVGSIAQSALPRERRGEGVGYFGSAATLGTALGPVAGFLAVDEAGYSGLFVSVSTVMLVALAVGVLLRRSADGGVHASGVGGAGPRRGGRAEEAVTPTERPGAWATFRTILPIGIIAFFQSLAYASIAAFMDVHTDALGFGAVAGAFFLVYASAVIVVRLVAGKVIDRRGPATVFYPSIVLYALSLVLVALAPSPLFLYVAAVLLGIGYGSLIPTGQTIAMSLLPSYQSGMAFVWYFLFIDLGFGLGPFVLGVLVDLVGTSFMILVSCGFVVLAGALFRVLLPDIVRRGG